MPASRFLVLLPFVPCVVGLALAVHRFRAHDPLAGLIWGELGMLAMTAVATRMPAERASRGGRFARARGPETKAGAASEDAAPVRDPKGPTG